MPSAISTGEVVKVKSEAPKTTKIILNAINPEAINALSVINPFGQSGVPSLLKNICKIADKITKNIMAFILFSTLKNGTFAIAVTIKTNRAHPINPI
jgi:hypothetical protein